MSTTIDFMKHSHSTARAIKSSLPVVALESTVLTHGLPRPQNLQLARDMEQAVHENGATVLPFRITCSFTLFLSFRLWR